MCRGLFIKFLLYFYSSCMKGPGSDAEPQFRNDHYGLMERLMMMDGEMMRVSTQTEMGACEALTDRRLINHTNLSECYVPDE